MKAPPLPLQALARFIELRIELRPVGKSGQNVMPRQMNDLGLRAPALGDVFDDGEPAAPSIGCRVSSRDRPSASSSTLLEFGWKLGQFGDLCPDRKRAGFPPQHAASDKIGDDRFVGSCRLSAALAAPGRIPRNDRSIRQAASGHRTCTALASWCSRPRRTACWCAPVRSPAGIAIPRRGSVR